MAEEYRRTRNNGHDYTSNSSQVLGAAALVTCGVIVLFLAGLTAVALVLLAPVLLLFSPILLPIGALLLATIIGLISTICFGLALISGVRWFHSYVNGRRPPGSDQIDHARMRVIDTACRAKHCAREYGVYLQKKLRHVVPGA